MAKKSDVTRTFNVAVVGLSGTEKEKGSTGVGKSCLCNRFIRPLADDYYTDHISVLSQTDFSGRVVNNDHFLYWGEVTKTSEEGTDFNFHVVEQTEFIDDSSFQPFKSGKTDPYYKRCSITKLTSAEKLMYICKNQLGIEKEYEQKLIPDGKLNIDGFICVFDVSEVQGRSVEKQAEYTSLILNNLIKTKKPIVLATTKNDEAVDQYIKEAERLVNRREYRNNIVIIETSAHENVNVELAFIVLAQMIDSRTKTKSKIVPFVDAARMRKEELDIATEAYQQLIRSQVTDYRAVWNSVSKKFSPNQDFIHYCNLFGHDAALKMFRRHVKKLKEEYIGRKIQMYIRILPEVLSELLPNLNSIGDGDWQTVRDMLRQHPDFNQYFLESPDEQPWQESDLVDSSETRIPFDLLDTAEAENCFEEHKAALDSEQRRKEMRKQFKQLLEETGYVTPGKLLSEVQVLFMGRECYESLSEQDLQEIYEEHQREITERAKQNFQELLLEHAELFYHFASVGPGSVITQEDINKITSTLQEDLRYKALDRLDQERMLMLLRHLGFVHGPIREHCPAFPKCMDSLIEKVIAQKVHRPSSWSKNSQWLLETENNQLNLVLLGSGGLAEELKNAIKAQTTDDIYEMDKIQYTLDFRIIDGDVGLPHNSFRTLEFMPHDICLVGCFCVYSNPQTLEYIRDSLEKTLLSNLEQEDRLPFHGLPIVILFAADASINEKDLMFLREEGQNRAKSLQCPFIDVSSNDSSSDQQFDETNLSQALQSLMQSIQRRASLLQIYHTLPEQPINPDIRIIMCMLCGDPYTIEHVLGPLLSHQCCFVTSPHTITLETYLGDSKRSVEVRVTSYHGANAYRDELVHGFILVYSTKRKASLSTLSAFSMNIPNIPIQILAVTETGSANAFFSSELSHQLITEGNAVADKLQAHFMTSTATCQQNTAFYTPFFKEVWEKKPQIEKAFHMEDLDYPIDGRTPIPPPVPSRQESYHIRSGSLEDGADSESLYEQLPMDNSRPEDEPASPASYLDGGPLSLSDDSDLYSSVYSKENGEHLVKPSRVKNKRSLPTGWVENRVYEPEFRGREGWLVNEVYHTYHTDRHKAPPPTHPKPGKTKQPKKLDLKRYNNLTDVIGRLSLTTQKQGGTFPKVGLLHAPLATPESVDLGSEYAQVKDAVPLFSADPHEYAYAVVHNALPDSKPQHVRSLTRRHPNREAFDKGSDSDSEWSSLERRQRDIFNKGSHKPLSHKKTRKKRGIPVAPPRIPSYEGPPPSLPLYSGGERRMMTAHSLDPLDKVRGSGDNSPSDGSDLSDDDDPRYKSAHRPKYKHRRSFRMRRRKQQQQLHHQPPQPSMGENRQFNALTSDSDLFSPSSKTKLEQSLTCMPPHEDDSSYEMASPRDPASAARMGSMLRTRGETEKISRKKEDKKKLREDEKLEKRRQKEEERQKRLTEKKKKKATQSKSGSTAQPVQGLEDFVQSEDKAVPLFVEKCIKFIEEEGLDSEGIYRVPGNRAHVELLFQKFEEDPQISIRDLDIPVNAVATALKDFCKRLPPLIPSQLMDELTDISGISYRIQDRSCRLFALRDLLKKLPSVNFEIIKFIFQHFVKVAENCRLNSMDSKNLAICWWPTLLPLEFTDMDVFERMRPHLEDSIQTMIDQFRFLFCGEEEVVMV
ncbi:rho GTPase-activating protein 190-like isoform X1 [Centruroides sculpturatus]|uniref:rho GTPase-activating protein 190-like isoform X1 n=1 Tax=Centruroides sculpturatus TaxID=218467 RepID=UPI000C6DC683|nr:rho GTPase-activating protein 190-like isoform X1 [Centruroides sculpturatus]XP_023223683.1 rho GTPase-activating protein 190-like isoform X1 [Centruroides sculpturatus]